MSTYSIYQIIRDSLRDRIYKRKKANLALNY